MSGATFHLVARASIIASGDSDDFHHVAPDAPGELVLVAVEAFDRVTRERDHRERLWKDTAAQRDEARRERDEARESLRLTRESLREHMLNGAHWEADAARLREALTTIERTGAPGATIVARRSDGHSCSWCRGMVTPCPVVTAREALKGGGE